MAKKEAKTDLWVYDLLKNAGISAEPQGSSIKEIEDALKTASKKGTGKIGRPEFVAVVKDYLIIIEDKKDLSNHLKYDDKGLISEDTDAIVNYAVNGAMHYANHIAKNTNFKKVFAIGISGDERRHKITPVFIDGTEYYRDINNGLEDLESFISLNEDNIDDYYDCK